MTLLYWIVYFHIISFVNGFSDQNRTITLSDNDYCEEIGCTGKDKSCINRKCYCAHGYIPDSLLHNCIQCSVCLADDQGIDTGAEAIQLCIRRATPLIQTRIFYNEIPQFGDTGIVRDFGNAGETGNAPDFNNIGNFGNADDTGNAGDLGNADGVGNVDDTRNVGDTGNAENPDSADYPGNAGLINVAGVGDANVIAKQEDVSDYKNHIIPSKEDPLPLRYREICEGDVIRQFSCPRCHKKFRWRWTLRNGNVEMDRVCPYCNRRNDFGAHKWDRA